MLSEAMAEEGDDDADDAEAEEASTDEAPVEEEAPVEAEAEEEVPAEEEAPAEDEAAPEGDAPVYGSMTVAELKDELKAKGLPVSGKKAELVERLKVLEGNTSFADGSKPSRVR